MRQNLFTERAAWPYPHAALEQVAATNLPMVASTACMDSAKSTDNRTESVSTFGFDAYLAKDCNIESQRYF